MDKNDSILKYYEGIKAYYFYLISQIGPYKEYEEEILNEEFQDSVRLASVINLFLSTKEEIVTTGENVPYIPKIFKYDLDNIVGLIAKKTNNGYKIDKCLIPDASTVIANIRNAFAHGRYNIDFDNRSVHFIDQNMNIQIKNLTAFAAAAYDASIMRKKEEIHIRDVYKFDIKDKTHPESMTRDCDFRGVIKKWRGTVYSLESNNDKEIDEVARNLFEIFLYAAKVNDYNNCNKLKAMIEKLGYEVKTKNISIKSDRAVEEILNSCKETLNIPNVNYEFQIKTLGEAIAMYILPEYRQQKYTGQNIGRLALMNVLEETKTTKKTTIDKEFEIQNMPPFPLNTDELTGTLMMMYNVLFTYPLEDIYDNPNEFTSKQNKGFDFSSLDVSKLKSSTLIIDDGNIEEIRNERRKWSREYNRKNKDLHNNIQNLSKVKAKGDINAENRIQTNINKLNAEVIKNKNELDKVDIKLKEVEDYINKNQDYLRNKAIIEGMRNCGAHGHYKVIGTSYTDAIIHFHDIYEGKTTFVMDVSLQDFSDFIFDNEQLLVKYLQNEVKAKSKTKTN